VVQRLRADKRVLVTSAEVSSALGAALTVTTTAPTGPTPSSSRDTQAARDELFQDAARAQSAVANKQFAAVETLWKSHEAALRAATDIGQHAQVLNAASTLCAASSYALQAQQRESLAVQRLQTCARLVPALSLDACHWSTECSAWYRDSWAEHVFARQGELRLTVTGRSRVGRSCHAEVQAHDAWEGRFPMQTMRVAPGRYAVDLVCTETVAGPAVQSAPKTRTTRVRKSVEVASRQRVHVWFDFDLLDVARPAPGNAPVVQLRYGNAHEAYGHPMMVRQLADQLDATDVFVVSAVGPDGLRIDWYGAHSTGQAGSTPRGTLEAPESAVATLATEASEPGRDPSWHQAMALLPAQTDIAAAVRESWSFLIARKSIDHRGAGMTPIDLADYDRDPWPWTPAWGTPRNVLLDTQQPWASRAEKSTGTMQPAATHTR
jgi:hypothetical protein